MPLRPHERIGAANEVPLLACSVRRTVLSRCVHKLQHLGHLALLVVHTEPVVEQHLHRVAVTAKRVYGCRQKCVYSECTRIYRQVSLNSFGCHAGYHRHLYLDGVPRAHYLHRVSFIIAVHNL